MMSPQCRSWQRGFVVVCIVVAGFLTAPLQAQYVSPAERSQIILNAARTAYNQQDYAFAAEKFREFLRVGSGRTDMLSARYGLALCLIDGPEKDYRTAIDLLTTVTAPTYSFADRPYGLYYLGLAYRDLAEQYVTRATTQPTTRAAALRGNSDSFLKYAANHFGLAGEAFLAAAPKPDVAAAEVAPLLEWAAKARCDQAQILIRLGRYKEASAAVESFALDAGLARSRYRSLALYYLGYAAFAQKDFAPAAKALAQLAPFDEPDFGPHAQFLLARTHHLSGDRAEAAANYQGVISAYESRRKQAAEALKNGNSLQLTPAQKAELTATVSAPLPDYVSRSAFYLGMLLFEQENYQEAAQRFTTCLSLAPQAAVVPEAKLHLGICQVQTRQFTAALRTLANFPDERLGDQAYRWLAKAQVGSADVKFPIMRQQLLIAAVENLGKSLELLKSASAADVDAGNRRATVLIELGDTQRMLKQFREAAATYAKVGGNNNGVSQQLVEHALHRRAVSLQLAGEFAAADDACRAFVSEYPKSDLMPEVMARYAENAMLAISAGAVKPADPANRYAEAVRRFQKILARYPEGPQAILAKQGQAMALYDQGKYAEAAKLLSAIPEPERMGELASVSYLEADCLLRTLPATSEDAIALNRLIEQLEHSVSLFNAFLQSQAGDPRPEAPEAQFKLAFGYTRLGELIVDPVEKKKNENMARRTLMELVAAYPNHPVYAAATFELARHMTERGAGPAAAAEFAKFQKEPLASSPYAAMAMILQGDAIRLSRKPDQAVEFLSKLRQDREAAMLKDPKLAEYVPVLQYSLALALKEAGKRDQARELFLSIAKTFPKRPEAAEVPWRIGQCMRDDATAALETARRAYWNAAKPEVREQAKADVDAALKKLREVADQLTQTAKQIATDSPDSELAGHINYDAAWAYRTLGDAEVEAARQKMQQDAVQKIIASLPKDDPAISAVRPHEIPLPQIPLQPCEKLARLRYSSLIDALPDSQLAYDSRFELAEVYSVREEHGPAIKLLKQLLEGTPPPDVADRTRLRLGAAYLTANDPKSAAEQFQAILQNTKGYTIVYARAGLGEALFLQKDWAGVVRELEPLLEERRPNRQVPGVTDRANLRLASAYAQLGRWQDVRNSLETFATRHAGSGMVVEARFAYAQACEQLKQYDQAAAAYAEVARRVGGELGAKAQYQAGLCYVAMDKPDEALNCFLMVAYAYDYPDLAGASLSEGAKICLAKNRPADARKHLQRIIAQQPNTTWAETARQQLSRMK
ncbi:MAG: tetratricopeptide repeat protein [Tepidisphaeraceae bacterium]